jgi:hypothetical protein
LKFDALTSADLIRKALASGYPGSVPQRYFDQQLSIILN